MTSQQKQYVINSLNSLNYFERSEAIEKIDECKIIEAKQILEERFWEIGPRYLVLNALYSLESNLTSQFAMDYYDTLQNEIDQLDLLNDPDSVNWEIKMSLLNQQINPIITLFELNNFTKANKVFELLNNYPEESKSSFALTALEYLLNNPEYKDQAKNNLINAIYSNNYSDWEKIKYFYAIYKTNKDESLQIAKNLFLNDQNAAIRLSMLDFLPSYDNEDIPTFLKNNLQTETDNTIVSEIVNKLLRYYGSPPTFHYLKEFASNNSDSSIKNNIEIELSYFKPNNPDSTIQIQLTEMLDTLQLYGQQCLNFNWVDNILLLELNTLILNAKTSLIIGDSVNCYNHIISYKQKVDFEYKDSLNSTSQFISKEGWQFLSNISQYILDRLPEPPANPNLVVSLKNSLGNQIPASNVKYYEGSWKDAVNNGDGTFTVITTRPTVSIRVFYEYASQQVDNVPAQNNIYTFTTVNAAVQLKNSLGNLIDAGTVQYYAGAWRTFGTTSNGVATKELLPINYSFRMTYEYGSIDKQQNLSTDPTVIFQTVNAAVQLKNSLGNLIDAGTVQYYTGAWRSFGTTSSGVANKELLPINYSFRMTYEYVSKDKQQNLSTNPIVDFNTVLCSVKVSKTSNNQPINNATVKYYAGALEKLRYNKYRRNYNKRVASRKFKF